VRKIGEPRAGFDLRKRTIEDAFSEGFPIRAMMNDAPMDHTGRAVLQQYLRHFRLDQKEELGMSLYVCPRAGAWETSESHHKL
jgi:hypothetical protein